MHSNSLSWGFSRMRPQRLSRSRSSPMSSRVLRQVLNSSAKVRVCNCRLLRDKNFHAFGERLPCDSEVGRSATGRMAGLAGFRMGVAASPGRRVKLAAARISVVSGCGVCGQCRVLDFQHEARRARTPRHRPADENVYEAPLPPFPTHRCRQGGLQRAYRPPDRGRSAASQKHAERPLRRKVADPLKGVWESDILPLLVTRSGMRPMMGWTRCKGTIPNAIEVLRWLAACRTSCGRWAVAQHPRT